MLLGLDWWIYTWAHMYSKLMVFRRPDSSVCPDQRGNYMSERSGPRSSRRSWRKWRGIYPCTQALQEEVRPPPQRQIQLRLTLLFSGQQSTSQTSVRLSLIVVSITFQTRKITDVFLIFQLTHIHRTSSAPYQRNCTTVLLDHVFLFRHWKLSGMLTVSCYFPDALFVY